jgi:hypothetical protein
MGTGGLSFNPKNKNQMIHYIKRMAPLAFAALIIASSCTQTTTNTQEQAEINTIDSTSTILKENTDKLEAQTKKVEKSLEKLDTEFKANN